MKKKTFKRLKKNMKEINWIVLESDKYKDYRETGEYEALCWLKNYIESKAKIDPRKLIKSSLRSITPQTCFRERDFILTLLEYVD
ncbi:MAG: hypothetical protein PVG65_05580 [Candidatus Thorarchaeota archaeon]|jgi:hypothetical protein